MNFPINFSDKVEQRWAIPLENIARVRIANLPTPLEFAPRLSRTLGEVEVLIKRDDLTGLGFGGNKVRILEYLLGDAKEKKADVVITIGGFQSNHARLTAVAARKVGLKPVLVLGGPKAPETVGNFLLSKILGSDMRIVLTDDPPPFSREDILESVAEEFRKCGREPYIIPSGGAGPFAGVAYYGCMLELYNQMVRLGRSANYVFLCSGSGGTQAGLALGAKVLQTGIRVVGISNKHPSKILTDRITRIANETADLLGINVRLSPNEVIVLDEYIGEGYGIPTEADLKAIRLAAESEGLFLDPVYTGKALAGLLDQIQKGIIGSDETVIFLHTGGTPLLFAYSRFFD